MKRGPGRPPHPDVLTPSEWRVLEQLRAGKPNAEIAVRLGISVNTVKYHVANILAKLELPDREAAAAWDGAPRGVRAWAPLLWVLGRLGVVGAGVAGAAAVGAVIVVVAVIGSGGGGSARSIVVPTQTAVAASVVVAEPEETQSSEVPPDAVRVASGSTTRMWVLGDTELPFEQHADYREYESAELEAAGFVDTGAFLRVPRNPFPIAESSYRAGFTGVRVADDGFVALEGEANAWSAGFPPGGGWSGGNSVGLMAEVDGKELYLTFGGGSGIRGVNGSARVMWTGDSSIAFYEQDAELDGPILMVAVADAEGLQYPTVIDTVGHLWVRPAPMVEGPVANDTGELLGLDGALGPLRGWHGPYPNLNWCEGGTCLAVMHSFGGLRAPVDARVACIDGENGIAFDVEASGYRIHFQSARVNDLHPPTVCDEGFPRGVSEGETLDGLLTWVVTAFDESGVQVGVAIDVTRIWVDVEPPAITECPPCQAGN